MQDSDGDTKIQVEESSDEDKIRFDTAGSERMVIDHTGVVRAVSGAARIGVPDSVGGLLSISGPAAGAEGGEIRIENSGAYDAAPYKDFWRIDSSSGNLRIGREGEQGAYFGATTSLLVLPAGVKLQPSQTTLDHYEEASCTCLLYTSTSPRDKMQSRIPSSA